MYLKNSNVKLKLKKFAIRTLEKRILILKGHNQLMHMRIRYHFLVDLHVRRCT